MKQLCIFGLFVLAFSIPAFSQEQRGTIGVGFSAGASNYYGDLDDNFTLVFTRPGVGIHTLFIVAPRMHVRIGLFHGRITADDAAGINFSGNKYRNLNFFSDINEAGLHILYSLQSRRKSFSTRNRLSPYVFGGIAYFHFNPKTNYLGETYELREIGTEGQFLPGNYPQPYSLNQWAIPLGGGFNLKLTKNFDLGAEIGFRKTFTDYLDDVSTYYPDKVQMLATQGSVAVYLSDPSNDPEFPSGRNSFSKRGNSDFKDGYVYTNLHLTYYFTTSLFRSYKPKNLYKEDSCKGLMKAQ
ncbi:MAG: hypothetical protein DWQ44_02250 [Bacteroidetes bacterium]|nr:MAG: hypothetical protein DWQ33_05980 [Bacteroidota bacterium]REK04795.1 MAG: hypothetical protein DWQ39_06145 [Bacteroidota bacterium]REK36268.1 MAG: hypothetical protein DWQ44_02250 [Bacteroidota bacterium]REK51068.1 MAG: hypothetical protein DWQ48_02975 [Bacteroidota bacterium]